MWRISEKINDDEAKDCEEAILDLQKQEKELALERLDYIEDYYDAIENLNDAYRDINDDRIEFNDSIGSSAISKEVRSYLTHTDIKTTKGLLLLRNPRSTIQRESDF